MKVTIFYSWQSDLPTKTNRYFIENSIKKSLKEINKDNRVIACIDILSSCNNAIIQISSIWLNHV